MIDFALDLVLLIDFNFLGGVGGLSTPVGVADVAAETNVFREPVTIAPRRVERSFFGNNG